MTITTRQITGSTIVADLEELAVAGAIDDVAVHMVRQGLFAIADRIRREVPRSDVAGVELVDVEDVLRLVEPDAR